jgi:hypothetical protein
MPTQTKANIKCRNVTSLHFELIVHRLLRIKPIEILTKNKSEWIAFLLFNILDYICTTCLVLQIFLENLFKVFLQIVKGIRI